MKLKESKAPRVPLPVVGLAIALAVTFAFAQQRDAGPQDAGRADAPQPQGRRAPTTQSSGGRVDIQQLQLIRMKELLAPTEEEWKVLEPRLVKVQDLLRDSGSRNAIGSGRGRRGGFGGTGSGDAQPSPVQQAARELQQSLASKDTPAEELKAKLTALRDARAKLQTDLKQAQNQLRELLTARQEAVLVMAGILN